MIHNGFILSPIAKILEEIIPASAGVGDGIETYPLCDYVMQSIFLKMTGAQEQKMKCICWELATNDYEYRYYRFTINRVGECSNLKEKTAVYKDLVGQIIKHGSIDFAQIPIDRQLILDKTNLSINEIFKDTNLIIWAYRNFSEYKEVWAQITGEYFAKDKSNLFQNKKNISMTDDHDLGLGDIYEGYLYKHRNRVAHNTLSYQQNLPTLKTLAHKNYRYDNYFIYFSLLILVDNVFMDFYSIYLNKIESL